jgi:DNA-binding MurR/RpiR family transcriptional regulator
MQDGNQPLVTNLDELKALVVAINRGESSITLGNKTMRVLGALLQNPNDVALHSISTVALRVGVNASTLTRLAVRLGFSGYNEFQSIFKKNLTSSTPFYSEQGKRLLGNQARGDQGKASQTLSTVVQDSVRNIESTLSSLDPGTLSTAAKRLARAPRVALYGLRQFHGIVSYLAYGLSLVRPDVNLLDAHALGVAEGLSALRSNDVLVVASVAPYTRAVVEVAQIARGNGIEVIALSDNLSSPLVTHAHYAFQIPHTGSYISNSLAAYLVFCEGLVNLVAQELGAKGLKSLQQREAMIAQLNIETP